MEKTEKSPEQPGDCGNINSIDLEQIIKELDSLSHCMDQLACVYDFLSCFFYVLPKYWDTRKITMIIDSHICKAHNVTRSEI